MIYTCFSPTKNFSDSCAAEAAGGVGGLLEVTPGTANITARMPGAANIDSCRVKQNNAFRYHLIKYELYTNTIMLEFFEKGTVQLEGSIIDQII